MIFKFQIVESGKSNLVLSLLLQNPSHTASFSALHSSSQVSTTCHTRGATKLPWYWGCVRIILHGGLNSLFHKECQSNPDTVAIQGRGNKDCKVNLFDWLLSSIVYSSSCFHHLSVLILRWYCRRLKGWEKSRTNNNNELIIKPHQSLVNCWQNYDKRRIYIENKDPERIDWERKINTPRKVVAFHFFPLSAFVANGELASW